MGAGDLSAALWQERRQLELLLFRLETQRLHVLAGNVQWLSFTASEVESVLDRLRFEALARSVESAAVAAEWGLPAQATLNELVAGAPPGAWAEVLQDHLDGLRALLRQLNDAARDQRGHAAQPRTVRWRPARPPDRATATPPLPCPRTPPGFLTS